ncbi:hypothetical protein JTE90_012406 [Oedothorax gibbosus]|uniref:Uncharacterized protein n=1 Tax=Oedothorax gibbosus TaxID=931172 RepID=A0AAV6TWK9_9ARAC|nr:hypothetical protein JTE90_012406 [Oedothorax gibbosus]
MTGGVEASSQTNRPTKDGCCQTDQTGSRVPSIGAPKSPKSHVEASTPAAKPKSNKGQNKSNGKMHQLKAKDPKPQARAALLPKDPAKTNDANSNPSNSSSPRFDDQDAGTSAQVADALPPEDAGGDFRKRTDFAKTPDSERSFAEVVGSGPSCPRGPKQVKSTAPSSNSGSTGRHPVTPGTAVKKTWPYIREVLVVGPLGNTSSSKLPFRSFMWNLLDTNGLGKPAYASSTLAGGLVMFFSDLQSLDAIEEALGRDDFR